MAQIKGEIDSKKLEIGAIESRRDKIAGEIEQSQNLINSNMTKLTAARKDFTEFNEEYRKIQAQQDLTYEKEKALRDTIKLVENKLKQQQEEIAKMRRSRQEMQIRSRIPMEFKKAQREGKLSGVFGRLGDLGTIPEEYDPAVSNGCSYLDHIVVESVEAGEKCL
jgi:structural maintenance of chromosome 4